MVEIKLNLEGDKPESGFFKSLRKSIAKEKNTKNKIALEELLEFLQKRESRQGLGIGQSDE